MLVYLKKWLSAALALLLCFGLFSAAMAESAPAGYPAVRVDPATGRAYDFGGRTVYLYDYWTGSNWADSTPADRTATLLYNYRAWLQDTYNCRIVTGSGGDWGSIADHFANFVAAPDGSLRIYTLPSDAVSRVMNEKLAANWDSGLISLQDGKWNRATTRLMSAGAGTYGVSVGSAEPRQCLFFNKTLLEAAGIDWSSLYSMQKSGDWTWSALESLAQKVQQDADHDGVPEVYGFTGSTDDLYRIAVFSNGGSFFAYNDSGKLISTADSQRTTAALSWAKDLWQKYFYKEQPDDGWNYYREIWQSGRCAFYVFQMYDATTMQDMADEWGLLAFPKGPSGSDYVTVVSENVTVIPAVYDSATTAMLTMIYDLWNTDPPGVSTSYDYSNDLRGYTDDRAIEETLALLGDPAHQVIDLAQLMGSINDVEGMPLLWSLGESELSDLLDENAESWAALCENYNQVYSLRLELYDHDALFIPVGVKRVESEAFRGTDAEIVVLPYTCAAVEAGAFADCPRLQYIIVPESTPIDFAAGAYGEGVSVVTR